MNRTIVKVLLWSTAFSLVLAAGYLIFGESIIRWSYDGGTIPGLVPARQIDGRSFEQYFHDSSIRFWTNAVIGVPLSLLVFVLLYYFYRYLIARASAIRSHLSETDGPSVASGALIAGLVSLGLTLLCFWPTLAKFGSAMIGPPEDNMACYWTLDWARQNILHGSGSFPYVGDLFYPEGSSFYFHAWSFYSLIGFSFLRLFMGAIAAYNILIMHTFVCAGVAGYLFTRYVTRNHWAALLAGVLFAFNPAHVIRAQHHMNIATIQFIPLFAIYFLKTARKESRTAPVWATLFLLLNGLVDWNYLLYCGWFMAFVYGYMAIRKRRAWLSDVVRSSAIIAGATLVVLSPWLIPMVRQWMAGSISDGGGHNHFVVDLSALVIPGTMHALLGDYSLIRTINSTFSGFPWETAGYLGLVAIFIVIAGWRELISKASLLILGALTFLLLALGAQPHVFGVNIPALVPGRIVPLIPLMSNSRALSRTMVFVYLFWSSIVAMGTIFLWEKCARFRFRNALFGILVALMVIDYVGIARETTPVEAPPCYNILPRSGERYGILDIPSGYREVEHYMLYQRLHGLPIVQGWVSRKSEPTLIDRLELKDMDKQQRQLEESRVRYIVIHKEFLPNKDVDLSAYRATYPCILEDSTNDVLQVY